MRTLLIAVGLSAFVACGSARAQSPGQQLYEKDEQKGSVRQPTPADRVHERAASEARARLQRIEARHAMGISLQRPTFNPQANRFLYVSPWGFYETYPPGLVVWTP